MPLIQETHQGSPRCPSCGGALPAGATCGSCALLRTARATSRLEFTVRQTGSTGAIDLELTPEFMARFELIRVLGRGASGMVLLARDLEMERQVAIKVLMRLEDEDRARFVAEGQMLARLASPYIVPVHMIGTLGHHPYLVTGYQPGGTLRDRLASGPLPVKSAVRVAVEILSGLETCHKAGIVHRDIKPENILFGEDGAAHIADLGIARHYGDSRRVTQAGALLGTPLYMAPEQVRGEDAGTRSDLHAVGLVLHEMLTGQAAIQGTNLADVLHAKTEPVPDVQTGAPAIPHALAAVVNAACALRAADRPASAAEMASRLERARTGVEPARGRAKAPPGAASRPPSRRAGVPAWAIGLSLACCAVSLYLFGSTFPVFRRPVPELVEQARDVEPTRAAISWKTNPACFSQIEFWQATSPQNKLRTKRPPAMQVEHRHLLPDLKPDTTYNVRFLFSYSGDEEGETHASEVFDFTTRPETVIFNVNADSYGTKAVVTWETNLRTDTTVTYGKSEQCEDRCTNPEQRSETVHSLTLEGLTPDTTYHYQIVASDPRGRGRPKYSEDLQFRTSKEPSLSEIQGHENSGMFNLARSYMDKLAGMTPDEREKLKALFQNFTDRYEPLSDVEKKELLEAKIDPARVRDFYRGVIGLRRFAGSGADVQRALYHLEREYYVNPVRAVERLRRAIVDVAAKRPLTPGSVRAACPDLPVPAPALPAMPVDRADAKRSFDEGEQAYQEGRIMIEQCNPEAAKRLTVCARHMARAVRFGYNPARALFYVGSALLLRDTSPEDIEKACELLAKSLALEADKGTARNLGCAHALAGRPERGIEFLEKAADLDLMWADPHFLLSGLYDKLENDPDSGPKAFEHAKAAVRTKPEYKKMIQHAVPFSVCCNRSARLIVEIIEKSEAGQLTDPEIDVYAGRILKDPSLAGAIFVADGFPEIKLSDLLPAGVVLFARAVTSPVATLASWFGGFASTASTAPRTTVPSR